MTAHQELDLAWANWQKAKNYQGWRKSNPGEAAKLDAYRAGGPRPQLVTPMGCALVNETAAWLLTGTTPTPDPPPPPPPGSGTLIFEDMFGGDLSKWDLNWFGKSGPVNGAENAGYATKNLELVDGMLEMSLTRESIYATRYSRNVPYTGSLLTTQGKFTVKPPYRAECRMYLPAAANGKVANWPAFWLNGGDPWPDNGENDVMEGLGGDAAYHYHYAGGAPGRDVDTKPGWRTFTTEVKGSDATYFYDGVDVGTLRGVAQNKPHYLILQQSISDHHPEVDLVPAVVKVDYVRVWQL